MICLSCNKDVNELSSKGLCRACYNYFKDGGTVNPLPDAGTIAYDERGYVICHICGKAYKERFGLCNNAKTTEANYSRRMRDYAYQYNMPEQLRITGANTRIKPGENHMRLGKATRLQENLAKRARRAS